MKRKGTGYAYEMLFALFFVVLLVTFYMGSEYRALMPPLLIILGGVMVLGGMVIREPLAITGGIVLFGVALVYSEVVT